jgi:hypothetical protein
MALTKNGKKLKNFDILLNGKNSYIIDFKGKKISYPGSKANRFENWLAIHHVKDLIIWEQVFKNSRCKVKPLLVFLYKLDSEEDKKDFKDIYKYKGSFYGVAAINPHLYLKHSKPRAKNIINVSRTKFKELVKPLSFYIPEIRYN